jgi:hypothetical protein
MPPLAALAAGAVLFAIACPATVTAQTPADPAAVAAISADDLRQDMRKLWVEHVVWTRDYVVAALAGHPGADASLERLLRNQDDLGDAVVPFYGEAAGQQLAELLREHIEIAGDLVAAAAAEDERGVTEADREWHRNATEIASFLAAANPHWTRSDLQRMMNEHLALTTLYVTARLEGDSQREISAFDRTLDQALEMADGLSQGLVRQFDVRS